MKDTRVPDRHANYHSETSTSGRGDLAAESSSRPVVTVVRQGSFKVPLGQSKAPLFGVDYLEPNKITEAKLTKHRSEYLIPNSIRWRIPGPIESLSNPKDNEVVFFTNILKLRVWLPLQPPVQRILAHLGYAPGQYNPNL
ncbi:hypothetical protein L3X38_033263 [Prunus dulcis]|uniref:Uncharacterized protein n=1 Tax=Prunus dulcis TaxID=3755 RepID=A0AAD4YWQ9_PRUDU|nr:hypothetical protein L3X38_033263 [Prunus dulcis]